MEPEKPRSGGADGGIDRVCASLLRGVGECSVDAHIHARYLLGIISHIHDSGLAEKAKMLARGAYTVPLSLIRYFRTWGNDTKDVIVMTFRKP